MDSLRLYYENAYLKDFRARVVERAEIEGRLAVVLDQTAFYPTSGGQPHDTGRLNGVAVLDVREQDGRVWHLLESSLADDRVQGVLDWPRRWDHMQNHSGQHVLSQAFVLTTEAETIAWHLTENSLTIDLDRAGLGEDDLARAEHLANQIIQENRAIEATLVPQNELPALDLRRQPDVDGPLRIVAIADFDRVACSGTHVNSTAQIGLIKVLHSERRGAETRIHFVCGGRALADYRRKHTLVRELAARFTRGEDELLDAVEKLQEEARATRRALRAAQNALVDAEADRLWASVQAQSPPRLISALYADWEAEPAKRLALALRRRPGCFAALAAGDPPQLFLARSDDVDADAGQLLRQVLAIVEGRGGGRSDYAQGRVPSGAAARQVFKLLAAALNTTD